MKAQIKRISFLNLVSQAQSLIEKRHIMPILSKILISAKKGGLHIQATDQDNSLQNQTQAKVETEGKVVVSAQNLFEILKELPEGDVQLTEMSGKKFRLSQGAGVFNLLCLDVKDFPVFPPFKMKEVFYIDKEVLKQQLEKTVYCSSMDETRYHLTGVFFETVLKNKKNHFRFTATDSHRLGLMESPAEKDFLKENGVIISRKGVQEIRKLISYAGSDKIAVSVERPRILFRIDQAVLSIKLVEGAYPNYAPLIPKEHLVSVKVSVEEMSQALKRVALLSNSRFKGVTFHVKSKKIQMEAEHPELGSAKDEVSCLEKTGEDLKVRFNARYILESLASIDKPEALIEFSGKNKPCLIKAYSKKESSVSGLSVVMPMKI